MVADYLIIGQGISGTMLSWFLKKEGKDFLIIDDGNENAASRIAAGMINPVTGRRYAYTWMIEEIMPFAVQLYKEMGHYFNENLIYTKSIIDFFPSPQMRNAFIDRLQMNDTYLHSYPDQNHFNPDFNYDFGCGEIRPAYHINISRLLKLWQQHLLDKGLLIIEKFANSELKVFKDHINYRNITAKKIIFCDGIESSKLPWFRLLPFAANKGEALIIECEGLNYEHIFKKGITLIPLSEKNLYWVGSNYLWEFNDELPTKSFFEHTKKLLESWLRKPFNVIHHYASVRPATIERRPFAGIHPVHSTIGILNGLGTKGTSLAPYFSNQLTQYLVYGLPISPEADVQRFKNILSK